MDRQRGGLIRDLYELDFEEARLAAYELQRAAKGLVVELDSLSPRLWGEAELGMTEDLAEIRIALREKIAALRQLSPLENRPCKLTKS